VVVYRDAVNEVTDMAAKNQHAGKAKSDCMPRTSVSFPPKVYKSLEDLAAKKKVSMAWVVREAVEKYLVDEFPLFGASLLEERQ
jgi:predicted DNA-binding protein